MVHFSIFDEEVEEAGQEVDAHCSRCKTDTMHTVIRQEEDEIRRVRCNVCDDAHAYRRPRGEEEESLETVSKKKTPKVKPTWAQVFGSAKKQVKAYHINEVYAEMDLLEHPQFGRGFVSQLLDHNKVEVTFEEGKRVLIHNRLGKPLPAFLPVSPPQTASKKMVIPEEIPAEFDALLDLVPDLDHDIDLGRKKSTKLSAKALAELDEEEEEHPADLHAEDDLDIDLDDVALDDDLDDEEADEKPVRTAASKKMPVRSKKTSTKSIRRAQPAGRKSQRANSKK